ncbi:FAD-binding protein [Breoghania sp.]|uniref:FAD-binding oxidoreductase n=1 Tax=Breoghania sp. TaxID=2065378 RepID=UPI0026309515|nr:FAD-binding protein [Breoghania sp.]MDJ0933618.1 FAD-binding protein [Breoghania sp.]
MDNLAEFRAKVEGTPLIDNAPTLRMKSRNFFWFSPILRKEPEGHMADLVLQPRDKQELLRVAAAARVPIALCGGSTGNYGQAVPLAGGVVLDMTRRNRLVRAAPGAARIEAGATLLEIDRSFKSTGW